MLKSSFIAAAVLWASFAANDVSAAPAAQPAALTCGAAQFTSMSSLSATLAIRYCNGAPVYGIGVSHEEALQNLAGFIAVKEAGLTCTANTSSVYTGSYGIGVYADFSCGGRPITAVGGSPTIAANNALAIATEMASTGAYCSAPVQGAYYPELHGFRFAYSCGSSSGSKWFVTGLGSSINDANAAVIRMLPSSATVRRSCSFEPAELNGVIFLARLNCKSASFNGYGSSINAAVNDALGQAGVP